MAAPRRERKVVTVLFCDLVGFTARAESLDPEDVADLLSSYHARLREELEHHGGTVEKFIGDAVMALFGAPVAHEDDPERAVRAALAIRDWAETQDELQVREAVTTGEALVTLGARPSEGEGMAAGDVVNTAARLQTAAPLNSLLVDETTFRATRHVVDYREAEAAEAKGKAAPVPVWEALAVRSRFGTEVLDHTAEALVGREREIAALRAALDRVRGERSPQLVTLVGVPGIGKSRLLYELSRIADADPELITWRQGRCLAYGDGVTFWALAEIVKAQSGILEADDDETAVAKLGAAVRSAVEAEHAGWVEAQLRPLAGLTEESELGGDQRGQAFAAWRRFFEDLAAQRPLVVVFEDLQWADEGLLDFVDELVDWISGVPLLVVCTARPELLSRRPGWAGGKLNASTIALEPLSDDETARLMGQLLESPVLPAHVQQTLLDRAGGNPLYAEQFAQLYVERGSADDLPLPETLQGIIAARLDDLPAGEKTLLQDASVVGKVFWTGSLGANGGDLEASLHALVRKGFVRRQRRSSVAGETELAFSHALVRDVAYGQIPRGDRAEKHRQVAQWLESLGRNEDHAEMLAHHWRSALELSRAAGRDGDDILERARLALRDAGDRAFALNAFRPAEAYYAEALALWPEQDPERPQLLFRRGHALHLADDERAHAALEEARDALLAAGDRETAAEAEVFLNLIWWHRGQRDEALRHLARAEQLAGSEPSLATARVLATVARVRTLGGDPEQGLRLAHQALEMAEALELDEIRIYALATIGTAKNESGDPEGREHLERAFELAQAANSPQVGSIANNLAVADFFVLDIRRTDALFREGLALTERLGDTSGHRWLRGQLGRSSFLVGRWDAAVREANEFIAECEQGSPHYMEAAARYARGWIALARGERERAIADMQRALALGREAKDPQILLANLDANVLAHEDLGRAAEAAELAREAIGLAGEYPYAAGWGLAFGTSLSRVSLAFEQERRQALERAPAGPWKDLALVCLDGDFVRAAEIWAAAGSPTLEARARLRAAEDLIEAGRRTEGEAELEQALAFYRSVGATFYVDRSERLLAGAA
jgi:class 3 adenylate cyclase/tetratricopeptide (TPR) repeat protein